MSKLGWFGIVAVGGCAVGGDPPGGTDGGQSGTAMPARCVEESRTEVADPSVPAEGFAFSADDALASVEGDWLGSGALEGAGEEAVAVSVLVARGPGPIQAVLTRLEEGDGTSYGLGAPDPLCVPYYEVALDLGVSAAPWVDVDAPVASALTGSYVSAGFGVDASEVGGDLVPPEWPNPELWDRTELVAELSFDGGGGASLSLGWSAINDDAASAGGTQSGTGTATVEPSGMFASIGFIELSRAD